ncbi:uncharacterized protein LOC112490580 isoform X2 [Ziziphus jujuba]|uniref:Uncharacterized protein LOC112490580 isoform X2 n=1 Tax=Ziziphus jujuba TaxID=326968 RepID=A0ABM3ZT72_ZIZJJ|nr:uncharacterized protein LOC112490580 isoform X2 [Ziziphus jujuba]XP_060667677.1 uncharacterized protein LOC112490580 isoform X2 [Ziziphus jujuba]
MLSNLEELRQYSLSFGKLLDSDHKVQGGSHNLATLKECHSLTNTMASSTAKSLKQLRKMNISHCDGMTAIISQEKEFEDEDEDQNEVAFSKLYGILLFQMHNLKSFCNGKNAISFPSLDILLANRCNRMKSFCGGPLSEVGVSLYWISKLFSSLNRSLQNLKFWTGSRSGD